MLKKKSRKVLYLASISGIKCCDSSKSFISNSNANFFLTSINKYGTSTTPQDILSFLIYIVFTCSIPYIHVL